MEDKETRRAIDGRGGKRKRNTDRFDISQAGNDDSEEDEDLDIGGSESVTVQTTADAQVVFKSEPRTSTAQPVAPGSSAVGSALQRNPDGSVVAPRVSKKKKQGKKVNTLND